MSPYTHTHTHTHTHRETDGSTDWRMALLILLFCAVSLSDGFNIDVLKLDEFSGNEEGFFGYKLLQYQSNETKQIIVSAPLSENRSGAIFKCPVEKNECTQFFKPKPDSKAIRFFGMSLAARTFPSSTLTSCSPSVTHECDGNSYLNGICYQFNSSLDFTTSFTPAFQECNKSKVNLVFLFDGSQSMQDSDFNKNKNFIWDIMTNLKNSSIEFAAVQFSRNFKTVFTFKDYVNNEAKQRLDDEKHMKSLTNTHGAIRYVLNELFDNSKSGADPEATKALVIITDGSPTDNHQGEIESCESRGIARFVIGVGSVSLENLKSLGSKPNDNYIFMIKNYDGLNGLLDKLQNKIYAIEGSKGRKFSKELSQSGFSAATDKDSLILGAVGCNDWTGALYEVPGTRNDEEELKGFQFNPDSYNGYSVVVGQRDSVSLVFSGAPRSNHRGEVTLFKKMANEWVALRNISGEQIGSYFGGSLCVLDLDSDDNTDFLVVGAPLYYNHHPQLEGKVYIYKLTQKLNMVKVLEVLESPQGRFGMTLAAIADLNGDQKQDLAVGAPLEDNHKGAIYIYLGDPDCGIRRQYSQKIVASSLSTKLQHFGLAIDGVMDMGQDGLTDIAVGAKGTVLLLKSRPVVSVSAKFSFSPSAINLTHFDCLNSPDNPSDKNKVITLNTCFIMTENTNSKGAVSNLNISWELIADAVRQDSRAFFNKDVKTSRRLVKSMMLGLNMSCSSDEVYMQRCVKDTVSPVLFRLSFKQSDPQDSTSILNIDIKTTAVVEVPFQINCKNTSCVSDLLMDFNFLNSTLLVVDQASFIIHVTLENKGDDSFNTSLVLLYPPGLSLSMFKTIKPNRRVLSSCGDRDEGALNKTTCSISLPVYPRNMNAMFEGIFRISRFYNWEESMQMTLVISSDNNGNTSNSTVMKTLPVQFSVNVAVSIVPELSVTYLNFSLEDKGMKPLSVVYKVSNLGLKGLPVAVSFWMPSQSGVHLYDLHNFSISVSQNATNCTNITEGRVECPVENCVLFKCNPFLLDSESAVLFEWSTLVSFPNKQNYTGKWLFSEFKEEDEFSVSAQLDFDKKLYRQLSSGRENDTSRIHHDMMILKLELVIPPDVTAISGTGGFLGFLLLIIIFILLLKCGFFKRKHRELFEEGNENRTEGEDEGCSADTNGKPGESSSTAEEKPFIPAGGNDAVSENGKKENVENVE
ncbi:integrin alpha-D [Tachysurus vachellii]|uniref:integrin alpha-D n=1 Tax=Tachysurus vachellii TaxID=175792 RepID=UPI00296AE7B5|nr:integrin alpha-D [Tachysurus vachellii]